MTPFNKVILNILKAEFGAKARNVFDQSHVLQYLAIKTRAADKDSKSRASLNNLYALYVIVNDYYSQNYHIRDDYSDYTGASFTNLKKHINKLPFGNKFQNHSLNSRLNENFRGLFSLNTDHQAPIIRDLAKKKYFLNESLMLIRIDETTYNISKAIIDIVTAYVNRRLRILESFIKDCESVETDQTKSFLIDLITKKTDSRIFEIVSYGILKVFCSKKTLFIGKDEQSIRKVSPVLIRTGRTNANDGGIDFVLRPSGYFFQVTENIDFKKFFLDIDKVEKSPLVFVIKDMRTKQELLEEIRRKAIIEYAPEIVEEYMNNIEDIFSIPRLIKIIEGFSDSDLVEALNTIVKHSKMEFEQ